MTFYGYLLLFTLVVWLSAFVLSMGARRPLEAALPFGAVAALCYLFFLLTPDGRQGMLFKENDFFKIGFLWSGFLYAGSAPLAAAIWWLRERWRARGSKGA